jgi:oxygen-independent coproporphyrinogen-3 oxidase
MELFPPPETQLLPCGKSSPAGADLQHAAPPIHALYLHVPFCSHKCHYCDFYSLAPAVAGPDPQPAFVHRLTDELTLRCAQVRPRPSTIFVGGGTPTFLRLDLWQELLDALRRLSLLDAVVEFTVEANPESVTEDLARVLVAGGVNRVSLGAQSFHPALLQTLDRIHQPPNVARAVQIFRRAGIANLNLDLIFAIPGQTLAQLDADLDAALALAPEHLSAYGLTYEPGTPLTARLQRGQVVRADEDLERAMYQRLIDHLAAAGFEHYEVSNWARNPTPPAPLPPGEVKVRAESPHAAATQPSRPHPSPLPWGEGESQSDPPPSPRRCQHNLAYWHDLNYLGLGPGAASYVAGHRWKNLPHLHRYLDSTAEPPIIDREFLPPQRHVGEALMLRLRLREGVPLTWLEMNLPPADPRHAAIEELRALGMLERTATHLRLTARGLFVADPVIARLL